MSSEWPVLPLEDCLDALIDYRGKTPDKTDSGIPLITAKIIKSGRIETPTEFIAVDNYDAWMRRGLPQAGDVVLTVEAPLGEVAQLGPEKVALAQRVVTLRGKAGLLDSTYLLYLLQSEEAQAQLKSRATGTTVLGIKQSELRKLSIKVPPLPVQAGAARTLKAIDDRINLLRETNITLEAIAQTLYKSWFVDFDPVREKEDGGTCVERAVNVAANFPSCFEDSSRGTVPYGWRVRTMSDVAIVSIGKTPPRNQKEWFSDKAGDIRWASIRDMGRAATYISSTSEFLTNEAVRRFNVNRVPDNTVILSFKMTIGRVAITDGEMTTNEAIAHFKPRECSYLPPEYIYLHLKQFNFDRLSSTSSIADAVNSKTIRGIEIIVPNREAVEIFSESTSGIFKKIKENTKQIESLSSVRDILLPRLIDGRTPLVFC